MLPAATALAREKAAPVWSQFQGGPGHPGVLAEGPAPPYRQAWRFTAPEGGLSGAVITGNVAITVGQDAVYGVNLQTGDQAWTLHRNGGRISMPAVAVVDGVETLAFVDTVEGEGTSLVRVDLASMRELDPRTPLLSPSRSGIVVDRARAFLGDDEGNVYGVDLATGALLWTAKQSGEVLATPAVAAGKVFAVLRDPGLGSAKLLALEADSGRKLWEFTPTTAGSTTSAPAASGDTVVVGTTDRLVHAFATDDGSERWRSLVLSLFSPVAAPAFSPEELLIADFPGGLYRIDPATGDREWDYQLNDQVVRSSPVISGSTALLGLNDGRLVAVDLGSAHMVWEGQPSPGLVGTIALSAETIVAVKGGAPASLLGFVHDPGGRLLDVPSPTVIDPIRLFGNAAIALAVTMIVLYLPFRALAARMGPAFGAADDAGAAEDGGEEEA